MTSLTGTATLIRLALRRDRVRVLVWVAAIALLVLAAASGVQAAYPTEADLEAAAAAIRDIPAQIALNGPAQGLDNLGGRVAFEVWNLGLGAVALMSLLMITGHTRAQEETGRTELVRAARVGSHAPTAAALLVVGGMNLLVGAAVALALIGQDLQVPGALTLGAAFASVGLVFAAVATVTAQVTQHSRVASSIAGAALAVAFVLRAVGDVGEGALTWLSPLGWAQASRPFAGERWWPLLVSVGFTALLVVAAAALASRRDVGAGLVPPQPGPATASKALARPTGFALRLQRANLIGWGVGVFLGGLAFGTIADSVDNLIGDEQAVRDVLAQGSSAGLTDAFLATGLLILAFLCTGFAIQSAQRLQTEEDVERAEPVLAAAVARWRWAGSHLAVALTGSVAVLAAAGLGIGLGFGVVSGGLAQVPRLFAAALTYAPAVWVLVGLTTALFGLVPRVVALAWAGLAASVVIGLFGRLVELAGSVSDVSPFSHVPRLPAAEPTLLPLLILAATAAALTTLGLVGFRQRDVR